MTNKHQRLEIHRQPAGQPLVRAMNFGVVLLSQIAPLNLVAALMLCTLQVAAKVKLQPGEPKDHDCRDYKVPRGQIKSQR